MTKTPHPDDVLHEELVLLRIALARRIRAKLEEPEPVTPAYMEAARKFLTDQGVVLGKTPPQRPQGPVVDDLPFAEPELA